MGDQLVKKVAELYQQRAIYHTRVPELRIQLTGVSPSGHFAVLTQIS